MSKILMFLGLLLFVSCASSVIDINESYVIKASHKHDSMNSKEAVNE